ncbi:MAG: phosphate signaling complex protein PhoU [Tissierellia bacterium]|nr:phosphate signaling complex protein PhoU [Bacillota bacterium]NLL22253.1 phosphate signaling complex protein PhoU [Tissierellia bacterium]
MRGKLDSRLQRIERRLVKMGMAVESAIDKSIESLMNNDDKLAIEVIEKDATVDHLELDLEKSCVSLIALEQPIARDLRIVTGTLKIITDLERIGDYAANIAKTQITVSKDISHHVQPLYEIAKILQVMVKLSLDAFVEKDAQMAREAALMDMEVDKRYDMVYLDYLNQLIAGEVAVDEVVPLILAGRYLERMGDHITNICERIIYMVEGVREIY